MTTALAARNFDLVPGGDYYCRSRDPLGAYFRRQFFANTATPVVTLTSSADQTPDLGTTYTAVFTSNIACSWRLAYWPSDDAVLSISADCLSATVTWAIPPTARKTSEYVGVLAETVGGQTLTIDRVHVGASSVRRIGSGEAYATLAIAIAGAPTGTRFVLKAGTYTSTDQFVNSTTGRLPNGVFSTYTDAHGNTRYTVTEMTTYMAETPFLSILDGGGSNQVIFINGNHPYEQECFDYDTAAGTTQFATTPTGTFSRVGLAIKGFSITGSLGECALILFSRFVQFQHIFGVMNDGDTFGINFARNADVMAEQCFFTGNMRGPIIFFKTLRFIERRCGSTKQNGDGTEPQDGHTIYECRYGEQWNCFDIDGKDAYEWYTGTGTIPASFTYPESDFHNDSYYPDFSKEINAGSLIGVNNYCATIDGEAWEHDPEAGAYNFTDIISWDNTLYESGYDVIGGGPFDVTNLTVGRVNNQTGNAWFHACFRPPQRQYNGLYVSMGWNGAPVDQGFTWLGRNDALPDGITDNFIIQDTLGTLVNPSFSHTFTNQQTSTNLAADGFKNLTRIQPGSRLATLNIGVQDAYKIKGKQGTFWGDTGYQSEVDRDWTETFAFETIAGLVRAYSYTGTTQTQGTQTLSGNRGWASPITTLREYLDTYAVGDTTPVHFPYGFNIQKIGTDIFIFLKQYFTAIREHRVYLNGEHALTIPAGYHCAQIPQLRSGVYEVKMTCVSNDGVESIYSRATSITL